MAKSIEEKLNQLQEDLAQGLRKLPPLIGEEAVNFSLDNFEKQGFQGENFQGWPKRKNPTKWGKKDETDRALLVKTGKLRRSIRVSKIAEDKVSITAGGADVPYARAHNEGFHGQVQQNVREHYRRTRKLGQVKVKAHQRTINQNIPRRQFIGESQILNDRITKLVLEELSKTIK